VSVRRIGRPESANLKRNRKKQRPLPRLQQNYNTKSDTSIQRKPILPIVEADGTDRKGIPSDALYGKHDTPISVRNLSEVKDNL
jgi:hypothetical protein